MDEKAHYSETIDKIRCVLDVYRASQPYNENLSNLAEGELIKLITYLNE